MTNKSNVNNYAITIVIFLGIISVFSRFFPISFENWRLVYHYVSFKNSIISSVPQIIAISLFIYCFLIAGIIRSRVFISIIAIYYIVVIISNIYFIYYKDFLNYSAQKLMQEFGAWYLFVDFSAVISSVVLLFIVVLNATGRWDV